MTPKKALIVDDSRLAQFVLKKMLAVENIAVDTSESAEDALSYLTNHKPDLIFLDHTMPGMNGLEALKVIKANPNTAAIPVMMYTSQEDINYMSQAQELGAIDVVPKQVKASELKHILNKLGEDVIITPTTDEAQDDLIAASDKVELKELVEAAEVALEKETSHQQTRVRFDEIQESLEETLEALNEKIDRILPIAENSNNKQMFWNNLLWGAIYIVTVLFFGVAYFQHEKAIETITSSQPHSTPATRVPPIAVVPPRQQVEAEAEEAEPPPPQPSPSEPSASSWDLGSLEQMINDNSQVPYGELLLGETVESNLSDLISILQSANFSGEVMVLAHDSTFCVSPTDSGQFQLPSDDSPLSQCDQVVPSDRLADVASVSLLQLVTSSNQAPENDFVITIHLIGAGQPLVPFPGDESTAGIWNAAALQNRRVIIELVERGE